MTAEEKTEQLKANREKLEHEIYVTEKKAKACEDDEKFLISTIKQYNRKASIIFPVRLKKSNTPIRN